MFGIIHVKFFWAGKALWINFSRNFFGIVVLNRSSPSPPARGFGVLYWFYTGHWLSAALNQHWIRHVRESEESRNDKRIYATVPYIKGISERLQRAFKSREVTLVHKPFNSLRSQGYMLRTKQKTLRSAEQCTTFDSLRTMWQRICWRNFSFTRNSN